MYISTELAVHLHKHTQSLHAHTCMIACTCTHTHTHTHIHTHTHKLSTCIRMLRTSQAKNFSTKHLISTYICTYTINLKTYLMQAQGGPYWILLTQSSEDLVDLCRRLQQLCWLLEDHQPWCQFHVPRHRTRRQDRCRPVSTPAAVALSAFLLKGRLYLTKVCNAQLYGCLCHTSIQFMLFSSCAALIQRYTHTICFKKIKKKEEKKR